MTILKKEDVVLTRDQRLRQELTRMAILKKALRRKSLLIDPRFYGLDDLLFPKNYHPSEMPFNGVEYEVLPRKPLDKKETDEEYKERQYRHLKIFIHDNLYIDDDGKRVPLRLADPVLKFIGDMFFGYVQRAILWKSRGGGGSLSAAVIMWLKMVYQQRKFTSKAGSEKQSQMMYGYTKVFWDCFPAFKKAIIDGEPLMKKTTLKTGASLACTTTSQKSVRGEHPSGLCLDELCQEDASIDKVFLAAINATLSKPNHCIILLSTFHIPIGLFQQYWDFAYERGFARYKWSIFQIMKKCYAGMEFATKEDPQARDFCMNSCPLTQKKEVIEYIDGQPRNILRTLGCQGTARTSNGFMAREGTLTILNANPDPDVFFIEFGTDRPEIPGTIYPSAAVEDSAKSELLIPHKSVYAAIGIDWGITEGCIMFAIITHEYLAIPFVRYTNNQALDAVKEHIATIRRDFGECQIFADSNPALANQEMIEQGYDVIPVDFSLLKDYGIKNLYKYFNYRRIAILDDTKDGKKLLTQLRGYKRNARTGAIEKKEDHGCDALLCASIEADFDSVYGVNRTFDLTPEFFLGIEGVMQKEEKSSRILLI